MNLPFFTVSVFSISPLSLNPKENRQFLQLMHLQIWQGVFVVKWKAGKHELCKHRLNELARIYSQVLTLALSKSSLLGHFES